MTEKKEGEGEEEERAQQRQQQEKQVLDQVRLFKRLLENQVSGKKITSDLDNPDVRKELEELEDIIREKLGKEGEGEKTA
jgi:hypothetical protein